MAEESIDTYRGIVELSNAQSKVDATLKTVGMTGQTRLLMEELKCGQTTLRPRLGLFKFSAASSCHFPVVHDHYPHSIGRSANTRHLKFLELARGETWGKEARTVEDWKFRGIRVKT